MKRNPSVSLRKPEGTSINRVSAFNREAIKVMFDNLESVMEKHEFPPSNIYNVDESGISTVQDTVKILAPKGKKRVGSVTSWERGKNITVICAMSASGTFIPPMFVFPRKRMTPLLAKNGPLGAIYHCSDNGWSNENLFVIWLQHFVKCSNASKKNQVLLILDNHVSHVSLEAYDLCRQNGITMVSLPPHTSHRTQPLDVSFFAPLKAAFKRKSDSFMKRTNCGQPEMKVVTQITPYDLAGIFNEAYVEVAKIGLAVSGFKNTGIFPFNREIFTDEDFKAADTLNSSGFSPNVVVVDMNAEISPPLNQAQVHNPGTSPVDQNLETSPTVNPALDGLLPIPGPAQKKRNARKKQQSEILTATPRKEALIAKRQKRMENGSKKPSKKPNCRIQLDFERPSSSAGAQKSKKSEKNKEPQNKKVKRKRTRRESSDSNDWGDISETDLVDDTDDDDDIEEFMSSSKVDGLCIICHKEGNTSPMWTCEQCNHSCHSLCSMGRPDDGLCDLCKAIL
ncbi:DDE [Nesidiocoris tenuis]|nr:DDE [Nesidiocoris tenuis]